MKGFVFPGAIKDNPSSIPVPSWHPKSGSAAGIDDFFFHAIRHTVETKMAELRIPPHIRDLLLDHVPARGSGAGYDKWHYEPEMREALRTVGLTCRVVGGREGIRFDRASLPAVPVGVEGGCLRSRPDRATA